MKKNLKLILFVCALVPLFLSSCVVSDRQNTEGESQRFRWIREESYFIDYTIFENTILFRYSFCFENNSDSNITLSCLKASFNKSELTGWLKYEKYYDGELENGDYSIIIKTGDKVNVIYVFSGEYLGGNICENLSVPDITMLQDYD